MKTTSRSRYRRVVRSECHRGHQYTDANTFVKPNGYRSCRACAKATKSAYLKRKKLGVELVKPSGCRICGVALIIGENAWDGHRRCKPCINKIEMSRYHAKKKSAGPVGLLCNRCGAELVFGKNWRSSSWRVSLYLCISCKASGERGNYRKYDKPRRDAIRTEMIAAYGGCCKCCGETESKFLGIDHIYGGGRKEREKLGAGVHYYRVLRKQGYPKDRFQLLCHNCNQAKGFYGQCPHVANIRAYISLVQVI